MTNRKSNGRWSNSAPKYRHTGTPWPGSHQVANVRLSMYSAPSAAAGRTQSPSRRQTPMNNRKSTRLNSSHQIISYAVFCLKKKKKTKHQYQQHTTKKERTRTDRSAQETTEQTRQYNSTPEHERTLTLSRHNTK